MRHVVAALLLLFGSTGLGARAEFRFREVNPNSLGLWEDDRPVLVYNQGVVLREGVPADRARSSYVHPLYGLDGEVLTDDFPADHHHHRGLFWAWPHVRVDGKAYDLWMLRGIRHGFVRWLARESGADTAVLAVENGWYVGNDKVMEEQVRLTVHRSEGDQRAIDLDCTWVPVGRPVTLAGAEGKSYGGLTLRFAPGTNTVITTALGNSTNDLYMTRLPWADLSLRLAGRSGASGAAVFIAPDHPDFPPTWLTRHYGVLCLGWPGVDGQTFPAGVPIRCRYRVLVHRGGPSQQQLADAFERYAREGTRGAASRTNAAVPPALPLRAVAEPERVRVYIGNALFTEYLFPADAKLPHFYPVNGPRSGRSVTVKDANPYPHHASVFFGCDRVNGGNYWQEGLDRGRIRSVAVRVLEGAGERVVWEQDCVWERPGAEPPFHDRRRVAVSAPSPDRRVIDFEVTLTANTDVRIEKTNHSLFSARMAPELAVAGGGRMINSRGDRAEAGTFGQRAAWADCRGSRGDSIEGLAIFTHPRDRWSPPPWFTRDYGFFSPTPMFWLENDELRLARGETIRLRYRVVVHGDDPVPAELDRLGGEWVDGLTAAGGR
jgi:hypothetical protein